MDRALLQTLRYALSGMAAVLVCATGILRDAPSSVHARPLVTQGKPANPVPMSDASIKAGRAVYGTWCRSCHGLQGRGDGITAPEGAKPANLTDAEWKYGATDAEIFGNIRKGIKPFTAMKPQPASLSDTDIWNVVNFIRSLNKTAKP